jgi:hypothetical protein
LDDGLTNPAEFLNTGGFGGSIWTHPLIFGHYKRK